MKSAQDLRKLLNEIHRKSYPAYKGTKGSYRFADYILQIDHVQGDPFASPSKVSVAIDGQLARFPKQLFDKKYKRIALQDFLEKADSFPSADADRRFWSGQPARLTRQMVTCLCVWK